MAILLLSSACAGNNLTNSSGHPVEIKLADDDRTFVAGSRVEVTLRNHSEDDLGYNLTCEGVERQVGDEWTLVHSGEPCATVLYRMEGRSTTPEGYDLTRTLPSGVYRLRATIRPFDGKPGAFVIRSESFVVRAPK
jgi:hypothetical protein